MDRGGGEAETTEDRKVQRRDMEWRLEKKKRREIG